MGKNCKHPTCGESCRRPVKERKVYSLKQSPIKKGPASNAKNRDSALSHAAMLKLAQMVFNKWIRNRDINKPCISSGRFIEDLPQLYPDGKIPVNRGFDAGHYYPAGAFSGVRFDEMNVNGQSIEDNQYMAGNQENYRKGLIDRYGEAAVIDLDTRARVTKFKKWSREELQEIIDKYKLQR